MTAIKKYEETLGWDTIAAALESHVVYNILETI